MPLEAALTLLGILVSAGLVVWQNRRAEARIRAENTAQHADGRSALEITLEASKAHTDAVVAPVKAQVDQVERKVDGISEALTGRVFPVKP